MAYSLPGYTEDQKLTRFIDTVARPRTEEMESLCGAVDTLVRCLHNFNQAVRGKDYRVKKTVKSGSLCKGTAVQNEMDIDIVVFLQKFRSMEHFLDELPEVLRHLEDYLSGIQNLRVDSKGNRYMVKCTIFHMGKEHDVDILPAVDMVDIRGSVAAVHREMAAVQDDSISHYSVCFAEYQKRFVKSRADSNPKVKDLIRLVKFWSKKNKLGKVVASFCLELICISVYEDYSGVRRFNMASLFESVIQKLVDIESLEISFDDYYQSSKYRRSWTPPYVMDPANPFQNTLPWDRRKRNLVAMKAAGTPEDIAVHPERLTPDDIAAPSESSWCTLQ